MAKSEVKPVRKYDLMHKNEKCGVLLFDEDTGRIMKYYDEGNNISPFLGTADIRKMKKWWEMRAVPASRITRQKILRESGCLNSKMYLAKNLGLSMTDTYWIRPEGLEIAYDNITFANIASYTQGRIPYHNATSYDPNASLGGQMEKYWDLTEKKPVLVKESYRYFGQQSIKTAFISGASVVYEATNLDRWTREKYIEIAAQYNISNTTLHILWTAPELSSSKEPASWLERLYNRLASSKPTQDEGWNQIISYGEPKEKAVHRIARESDHGTER